MAVIAGKHIAVVVLEFNGMPNQRGLLALTGAFYTRMQ
jgi:hypothetical protein